MITVLFKPCSLNSIIILLQRCVLNIKFSYSKVFLALIKQIKQNIHLYYLNAFHKLASSVNVYTFTIFSMFRFTPIFKNCLLGSTPIPLKHQLAVGGYAFVPNADLFSSKKFSKAHICEPCQFYRIASFSLSSFLALSDKKRSTFLRAFISSCISFFN